MFKKSDTLPLILAFVTTVLIVTLGFSWLANSKISAFGLFAKDGDGLRKDSIFSQSNLPTTAKAVGSEPKASPSTANGSQKKFVVPVIVPQGTSVTINGSAKLNQINHVLRRSFHRQYPGTVITTKGDGGTIGLNLLSSREIDIAALDRPLSQVEKDAGLREIAIYSQSQKDEADSQMYYVYQEPLSPDTETFLGYVLSEKGQQTIDEL